MMNTKTLFVGTLVGLAMYNLGLGSLGPREDTVELAYVGVTWGYAGVGSSGFQGLGFSGPGQ